MFFFLFVCGERWFVYVICIRCVRGHLKGNRLVKGIASVCETLENTF